MPQFFQTPPEIEAWLQDMGIQHYSLEKNTPKNANEPESWSVKTKADVYLSKRSLNHLPVQFSWVGGDFDVSHNQLTSLLGAPRWVGLNFNCSHNNLTGLEHSPKKVGTHYHCSHNRLTSLQDGPIMTYGLFDCSYNQLTSLEHGPNKVYSGYYDASGNLFKNLKGAPVKIEGDFFIYDNAIDTIEALMDLPLTFYLSGRLCLYNPQMDIVGEPDFKFTTLSLDLEQINILREKMLLTRSTTIDNRTNETPGVLDLGKNKKVAKI